MFGSGKYLGGIKEGELSKGRNNQELHKLYGKESITQFIRAHNMRRLGHVESVNKETEMPKSKVVQCSACGLCEEMSNELGGHS